MKETLPGMRQDLKDIRLAQISNHEAKGAEIIDFEIKFSEQKKDNEAKEIGSTSKNTKVTPSFLNSNHSYNEEIEDER